MKPEQFHEPTTMLLAEVTVDQRVRRDLGNIASLAASIASLGLLHPLVVKPDGTLVAGARRLEAVRSLGWTEVPVTVVHNLTEALPLLQAERDENTERKAMTLEECVRMRRAGWKNEAGEEPTPGDNRGRRRGGR
jgi:ParB family chromosome partitioning protein